MEHQIHNLSDRKRMKLEIDVENALGKLPRSLANLYASIYDQILHLESYARLVAKATFSWLLCAQRPLSSEEMIVAVSPILDGDYRRLETSDILDVCANLVAFDPEADIFRFAHSSIREFIEDLAEFAPDHLNSFATARCLDEYLNTVSPLNKHSGEQTSSFRSYAAISWPKHYKAVKLKRTSEDLRIKILKFALVNGQTTTNFQLWAEDAKSVLSTMDGIDQTRAHLGSVVSDIASPLFVASVCGIIEIVENLQNVDWNGCNVDGATAIYLAARHGHSNVVEALIAKGVDVNVSGGRFQSPLQAACFEGHEQIVTLLLKHGADPRKPGAFGNALQAAYAGHSEPVVLLLLDSSMVLTEQSEYDLALELASYGGHNVVVQLLLTTYSGVFDQGSAAQTQHSLPTQRYNIAQALFHKATDLENSTVQFNKAMQEACLSGHEQIVRFLIAKGADIHAHGRFGTPLRAASLGGNEPIVRRLLASGASLSEESTLGDGLQAAALKGHTAIVSLLLANGADVNARGGYHGNALQAASFNGHEDVVRLLIEKGADVTAPGRFVDAVQAAFETGQDHLLQLLLDQMDLAQEIPTPNSTRNEDTNSLYSAPAYTFGGGGGGGGGGSSWARYCQCRPGYSYSSSSSKYSSAYTRSYGSSSYTSSSTCSRSGRSKPVAISYGSSCYSPRRVKNCSCIYRR